PVRTASDTRAERKSARGAIAAHPTRFRAWSVRDPVSRSAPGRRAPARRPRDARSQSARAGDARVRIEEVAVVARDEHRLEAEATEAAHRAVDAQEAGCV